MKIWTNESSRRDLHNAHLCTVWNPKWKKPGKNTPWTQNLGHAHVCEPCAVACATKSTIVFALNASGKIVALNNHWPNRCFVVAGGHHAGELSEVWPQPGMGGRYAPSRLRLHKPSGLTLLGEDRFMIVVDRSLKCALFVVEYPWRWSPSQATRSRSRYW